MNYLLYRDFLLKSIPSASLASGGREVNCRCFFCPDSRNPNSAHMYISIPSSNREMSTFYCHKCHASGVVTYRTLIDWDIYDDMIALELIQHNKEADKYSVANRHLVNKIHYHVNCLTTSDTEASRIKLKYINDRIGTNFTYQDLRDLKIVLNLGDVIRDNHITDLTRDERIVEQLDNNFLGFLSIDNAFLNMRRVCDKGLVLKSIDKRYINYKLYDKYDTSERFYTIPTVIDACSSERIKIHIAEGPFDILSIYQNVRQREPGIYTSIAGSNYKAMALYFMEVYKLPYIEIHYYPDNDRYGSTDRIRRIADYMRPTRTPVYVHRNTFPNEKDFGVSPDRINEVYQIL